jgi:hypothetical protein
MILCLFHDALIQTFDMYDICPVLSKKAEPILTIIFPP